MSVWSSRNVSGTFTPVPSLALASRGAIPSEAIRLLESGVASKEDIDQAMKLGCGYPMGPFTLLDLVGLDTTMYVAEVMFQEFREARFAPPPLLRRMVMAGHLGRKSGKGFYEH